MYFCGEVNHQLDEKGRFRLPPKFRAALGLGTSTESTAVMLKGSAGCIMVYPKDSFDAIIEKRFATKDFLDDDANVIFRVLFSSMQVVEEDRQGRISLSQSLALYAGITKNITTIGVGNRLEIWDTDRYTAYMKELPDFNTILNAFANPNKAVGTDK